MGKLENLTGQPFGKLTVIKRAGTDKSGQAMWLCRCSCTNKTECIVRGRDLRNGHTKSCGCYSSELTAKRNYRHGQSHTRIYRSFAKMKSRCYNKNDPKYYRYGKRGITVCAEWLDKEKGFNNFYNVVSKLEHFGEEGYSLNRIDNDGNYEPDNVEWATDEEQQNNTSQNRFITYKDETKTVKQWADKYRLDESLLCWRLKKGWSIERALTEKPYKGKNQYNKKTS